MLGIFSGDYVGYDWFVLIIFFMMYGDFDLVWEFFFKCFSFVSFGYLWVCRLYVLVRRYFKIGM